MSKITFARRPLPKDFDEYISEIKREIVIDALEAHGLNRTRAGLAMGLSLRQMRHLMQKLGVSIDHANETSDEDRQVLPRL